MRSVRSKGIVLITTLLTVLLVFMMVSAAMQSGTRSLQMSSNFYNREAALAAAESGVQYAMTRLQSNKYWRGDSNGDKDSQTFGDFSKDGVEVTESNGNVIGLIKNLNGTTTAFRIKFSYEDTDQTEAALNKFEHNPAAKHHIDSIYVSLNNLDGASAIPLYRAKGANDSANRGIGVDTDKRYANLEGDDTQSYVMHVPAKKVCIIAEGLAGTSLAGLTSPLQVEEKLSSSNCISLTRRYVEAYMGGGSTLLDCAAYSKGDMNLLVNANGRVLASSQEASETDDDDDDSSNEPPSSGKMRSLANFNVKGGPLNTFGGQVYYGSGTPGFTPDTDTYKYGDKKYTFSPTSTIHSSAALDKLGWDDIKKADDNSANKMNPGLYEWHKNVTTKTVKKNRKSYKQNVITYELRYYGSDYTTDAVTGKGVPADSSKYSVVSSADKLSEGQTRLAGNDRVKVYSTSPTLDITGNLYCKGDFVIQAEDDMATIPVVNFSANSEDGSMLTSTGNVKLISTVKGNGSIAAQKDVTFKGESVLSSSDSSGMSIYAGGDVTLLSLDDNVANAEFTEAFQSGDTEAALETGKTAGKEKSVTEEEIDTTQEISLNNDDLMNSLNSSLGLASKENKEDSYYAVYGSDDALVSANVLDLIKDYLLSQGVSDSDITIDAQFGTINGAYVDIEMNERDERGHLMISAIKTTIKVGGEASGDDDDTDVDPTTGEEVIAADEEENQLTEKQKEKKAKEIEKYIERNGSVCYGDQKITGIIYACGNFIAQLGTSNYTLYNRGGIKAESGKFSVTAKNVDLTYDSSFVEDMRENESMVMKRELWTSW